MNTEAVTICLNRKCPRQCPQCGLADGREGLGIRDWIKAISTLKRRLRAKFFLFVGCEPLMFGEDLLQLIRFLRDEDIRYGMYSTSPEPMFSHLRKGLIDNGLENWSSGIDCLPGDKDLDHHTQRKVEDSIRGLIWMAERGVQTHTVTTVHRQNLDRVVDILLWCQDNIPGVQSSLNLIEWDREGGFDFFAPPEAMKSLLWTGTEEEKERVRRMAEGVVYLSRTEGMIIQTPDSYLIGLEERYTELGGCCGGVVGPAVDCDGTMRVCGYAKGEHCPSFDVMDLEYSLGSFLENWAMDLDDCPGCQWIFKDMLAGDTRILDPKSGFHQDRWAWSREAFDYYWSHKEVGNGAAR